MRSINIKMIGCWLIVCLLLAVGPAKGTFISFHGETALDLGVGFGNILQTLVLRATPDEWGSVSWEKVSEDPDVFDDVLTGNATPVSQTQTVADMKALGMTAENLFMVFNLNQTGGQPPDGDTSLDLHKFTVHFYHADGTEFGFNALYVEGEPGPGPGTNTDSSLELTVSGQGQGSAGYVFPITFGPGEGVACFGDDASRIGVSVPETQADRIRAISDDGPESFYVAPEPATLGLMFIGGLALLRRRK